MFCINCGTKLVEGANFCPNCGKKVGETPVEPKIETQVETQIEPKAEPTLAPAPEKKNLNKLWSILHNGCLFIAIACLFLFSFFIKSADKSIFTYITEPFYSLANKFPYETIYHFITAGAIIANFIILTIMFIKGIIRLTAARASSPIKRPTNSPSAI